MTKSLFAVTLASISSNSFGGESSPTADRRAAESVICAQEFNQSQDSLLRLEAYRSEATATPIVTFLDDVAVIVEYPSVYDVHSALDPSQPARSQGGSFVEHQILADLEPYVQESKYDFVLMFSLQELPGWIHSGTRWNGAPAKNIGQFNSDYGKGNNSGSWTRLKGTPHMNSIDLFDGWELFPGSDGGTLVPIHEIGHYWMVNWSISSKGPREWRPGDPLAHLAGARYHWSWNWTDTIEGPETMPGIMYSAPLSFQFNAFDMYAMGLVNFDELSNVSYTIYECAPPNYNACNPGDRHELKVEHLVQSLALEGPLYFEGDGRRIPASDDMAKQLNILIVVVKGKDEALTGRQEAVIRRIASDLPDAWATATWSRSQLSTQVTGESQVLNDLNAGLNDAWVNAEAPFQGLLVTVLPQLKAVFLAWFTFDSVLPTPEAEAVFGAADHRWVTALGTYEGNHAELTAELTSGGVFNSPVPAPKQVSDYGTIKIEFERCDTASVEFDFPAAFESGSFIMHRVLDSNVALCNALANGGQSPEVQANSDK